MPEFPPVSSATSILFSIAHTAPVRYAKASSQSSRVFISSTVHPALISMMGISMSSLWFSGCVIAILQKSRRMTAAIMKEVEPKPRLVDRFEAPVYHAEHDFLHFALNIIFGHGLKIFIVDLVNAFALASDFIGRNPYAEFWHVNPPPDERLQNTA